MAELMYCGVKAVIRRKDGRILFVKQKTPSFPKLDWYLSLPGGRLDTNEDPYKGLEREVLEELKLAVKIGRPLGMYYFMRDDGKQTTLTVFECHCDNAEELNLEDNTDTTEVFKGFEWLTAKEALQKNYPVAHPSFNEFLKTI